MGGAAAYLTIAFGTVAGLALWFGLWPVAAVALAFLIGGRREPVTVAADAIVVAGLAGHADPLWVGLLLVASLAAREHDPKVTLALLLASVAATFVYLDWTILTGLLAALRTLFVANRARARAPHLIARARSPRAPR